MLLSLAVSTQAQTSLVATLSHEGNVTTFYSANGLKDAYADAVDGDIITLSPGSFAAVDIAKDITIRGAGMMLEDNPTIINGDVKIQSNPEGTGEYHLTMEGVYVHGTLFNNAAINSPAFIKTRVKYIEFTSHPANNAVFADCIIDRIYLSGYDSQTVTASFISCVINDLYSFNPTGATLSNCVIKITNTPYNSAFTNCIFIDTSSYSLYSSCTAAYCYYQGPTSDFYYYIPFSATNHVADPDVVIFKDENTYELSDDIAATWLGSDGTQVGIYGGPLPFDPIPSNPRITKFNVAPKTTADGKLSVEIEVKSN